MRNENRPGWDAKRPNPKYPFEKGIKPATIPTRLGGTDRFDKGPKPRIPFEWGEVTIPTPDGDDYGVGGDTELD